MKICFFCGKEISDTEISANCSLDPPEHEMHKAFLNYYICPHCSSEMSKGIPVLAIKDEPIFKGQEPICKYVHDDNGEKVSELYPTGEWAVFDTNTIKALFEPEIAARIIIQKSAWVSPEVLDEIKKIYEDLRVKNDDESENSNDTMEGEDIT